MPPQLLEPPTATTAPPSAELSDSDRLRELEVIIGHGLGAFLQVGRALTEIRGTRLHEAAGYSTWPAYLRERWELSEARASQLVNTVATAAAIGVDNASPLREATVRELTPVRLERGDQAARDAWAQIMERHTAARRPTARAVRATLRELGLPTYGAAPGRAHAPRLDQLGALLDGATARVVKLAGQRDRDLDPLELLRLAAAARVLADQLEALTAPDDDLCVDHGRHRDDAGICVRCRRRDLQATARVLPAAA